MHIYASWYLHWVLTLVYATSLRKDLTWREGNGILSVLFRHAHKSHHLIAANLLIRIGENNTVDTTKARWQINRFASAAYDVWHSTRRLTNVWLYALQVLSSVSSRNIKAGVPKATAHGSKQHRVKRYRTSPPPRSVSKTSCCNFVHTRARELCMCVCVCVKAMHINMEGILLPIDSLLSGWLSPLEPFLFWCTDKTFCDYNGAMPLVDDLRAGSIALSSDTRIVSFEMAAS